MTVTEMPDILMSVPEFLEALPEWSVDEGGEGSRYAGTLFPGHRILAARSTRSAADDRMAYEYIRDHTEATILDKMFRHWKKDYVEMLLIPPDAPEAHIQEAMHALAHVMLGKAYEGKEYEAMLLEDADAMWVRMTKAEREEVLTEHRLSTTTAAHSLPPKHDGLIRTLATDYELEADDSGRIWEDDDFLAYG